MRGCSQAGKGAGKGKTGSTDKAADGAAIAQLQEIALMSEAIMVALLQVRHLCWPNLPISFPQVPLKVFLVQHLKVSVHYCRYKRCPDGLFGDRSM